MDKRNITPQDLDNAKRLRNLWNNRKGKLGLTQLKAAEKLGFQQPMVSQLLSGKVALNTDHILKWAQLLGASPDEIDPRLSSLGYSSDALRRVKVPIVASLSGAPVGSFQNVEISTRMTRQVYGVTVDDDTLGSYAKRGSTLIVSQEEEPISGDEVFIRFELDGHHLHLVAHYVTTDTQRGVVVIKDLHTQAQSELELDRIEILDPIVSVERPIVSRPIRLRPRRASGVS